MSSIDTFGQQIAPRMPDRGIRRRGALTNHPFPSEDLDAYVKELVSRSSAEVGASSRHLISDFGTGPAAGDPIATNYGGVGSLLIWVTAAGQVKRLWLSGEASDGASGHVGATKIEAMPDGAFVFRGSSWTKTSLNYGLTLGSNWTNATSSVYYHKFSGLYVTLPSAAAGTGVRFFATLADTEVAFPVVVSTSPVFNNTWGFVKLDSEFVYVTRYDSGQVKVNRINPTTGGINTFANRPTPIDHKAIGFRGSILYKLVSSGVAHYQRVGISDTGAAAESSNIFPTNVTLSTTSVPIVVGNLVFDEDAAGEWLWYSADLSTWHPHSPLDASDTIRTAVGSRLLTNDYISGPCI